VKLSLEDVRVQVELLSRVIDCSPTICSPSPISVPSGLWTASPQISYFQ